jgi:hypothetical protein
MKHTIQTLRSNLTIEELDAIEKELQSNLTQNMEGLSKENKAFIKGFQHAIKEVLGVGENKP